MKTILIALALVVGANAAEPATTALIAEIRSIVMAPDKWADMTSEMQKLDSLAKRCKGKKRESIEGFRRSFARYSAYFSDHPFALETYERAAFELVVRTYEERFTNERHLILESWRKHPDQGRGCVDAATLALSPADHELERCRAVFAKHNSNKSRPNELAAAVIGVLREYGGLLASLSEAPISERSAAP